ncbi:hypothetical protein HDV57DRAFT_487601 [Trichoderma longibrachiatum]
MLEDDPGFDPLAALPNFDLLRWDKDLVLYPSQGPASNFSQMTPLGTASQSSSSPRHPPALINLQLPPSSQSAASGRIPSDFGNLSPLFGKSIHLPDDMPEFNPFGEDEYPSVGLDFDGEGNLIGLFDAEPELPPLPVAASPVVGLGLQRVPKQNRASIMQEEENLLDFGDDAQQVVGAIQSVEDQPMEDQQQAAETAEGETAQASARMARTRRPGLYIMLDTSISLPSSVMKSWSDINRHHLAANLKQQRTTTTPAQAKKNAMALLYEHGVAHVGAYHQKAGLDHPLATEFAGIWLKARLQGQEPDEVEQHEPTKRGRRRKSDEAFEGEQGDDDRNTRPRTTEDVELGRGVDHNAHDDAHIMFDDNSMPEIGMEAAPPMEDRHSSSMMPWSRPGSAVPGSSVRGSAQKSKVAPSPLFNRGSALGVIDRHSDPGEPLFGLDDFGSQDSSFQMGGPVGPLDFDHGNDTQASTQGLDVTSQNFLEYATEQAEKTGVTHSRDPRNRRWIEFEELADPSTHTKAIAAQAFLHVLSLATKNVVSVRQDGVAAMQPFGTLRIGIKPASEGVYAESDDELA